VKEKRLERERTLKTWDEYERILSSGIRIKDKNFLFYFSPKKEKVARIGILVPKRLGKAAKRNRVKRLLREGYRLNQELFNSLFDIVLKAQKDSIKANFKEIEESIRDIGKTLKERYGEENCTLI
jgi:ribonuclease P protein component